MQDCLARGSLTETLVVTVTKSLRHHKCLSTASGQRLHACWLRPSVIGGRQLLRAGLIISTDHAGPKMAVEQIQAVVQLEES